MSNQSMLNISRLCVLSRFVFCTRIAGSNLKTGSELSELSFDWASSVT